MRILHTSDWHLGQHFMGKSRQAEHQPKPNCKNCFAPSPANKPSVTPRRRQQTCEHNDGPPCRQGFEFLGYRFEAGRRWVRDKSLKGFKDKVREKTRRTRGDSMRTIIDDLTPTIRGWYGYFQHAYKSTFPGLDGFIRRRLRSILRKQEKRPGLGRCRADHTRWPNAYFANLGLFTMTQARQLASQSR